MQAVVKDLSKKCGIDESKIQALLNELGLKDAVAGAKTLLNDSSETEVTLDQVRLSVRIGDIQVSR